VPAFFYLPAARCLLSAARCHLTSLARRSHEAKAADLCLFTLCSMPSPIRNSDPLVPTESASFINTLSLPHSLLTSHS
jgi:hypothetical protein